MSVLNVTEKDFDQVINSGKLVLVDFWAVWCRPCQMMGPVMEELAQEFDEKIVVAKVDVDSNEALCTRFGITNIPNMKLFKNGLEVANIVGAVPKNTLVAAITKNL
ncbi:MAG: thioredoxin [Fibrobacter sp.]|jgi:thioredoxin 1|nr:thioredoxin [Fibrobacter sp.]